MKVKSETRLPLSREQVIVVLQFAGFKIPLSATIEADAFDDSGHPIKDRTNAIDIVWMTEIDVGGPDTVDK